MEKYFRASGFGGILRGLFANLITVLLIQALVVLSERMQHPSGYEAVLGIVGVLFYVLQGWGVVKFKRFPLYYLIAVVFFWGLATLVLWFMEPKPNEARTTEVNTL